MFKFINHLVLNAALATSAFYAVSCAPTQAKAIRDDKSFTLGYLGVAARPTGNSTIGLDFNLSGPKTETIKGGTTKLSGEVTPAGEESERYKVKTHSSAISLYSHFYPWDTSAFFFGLGLTSFTARYKYDEHTEASTALAPVFTQIDYKSQATYAGIPMGWAWIWNNGFTVFFDFGPMVRVARSGRYEVDGLDLGVNSDQRDQTAKAFDNLAGSLRLGASGLIGYSF